jgi:hypothetical protein
MFNYNDQVRYLERFQDTLRSMLYDLRQGRFTIDEIVNYYHSLNFIQDFTLLQRYNYNISVLVTDLGIESEDEDEGGEEGEERGERE